MIRVLVICQGNLFRSPLLARELRLLRPGWDVRSAGTVCEKPGSPVPAEWRSCVDGWTEPHTSRRVTAKDVMWADICVVTEMEQASPLQAIEPHMRAAVLVRHVPDPNHRPRDEWPDIVTLIRVTAAAIANDWTELRTDANRAAHLRSRWQA